MRYAISGVWKDANGTITYYAFHTITGTTLSKATKVSKAHAVQQIDAANNSGITVIWDYINEMWDWGEEIHVAGPPNGRYLRSNHDNSVRDNLGHLINYGWICNNFT